MNAPTPGEFAKQLAERYGPAPDPLNPFFRPAKVAVRRLVLQAVVEVFGPQDPLAQFLSAFDEAELLCFPVHLSAEKGERVFSLIDDMRHFYEVIERDFTAQAEAMTAWDNS